MISPLSVSCAPGMIYDGISGTTLQTFNDVLHFLYLIKENSTGAIVFIGTVGKPEYS